MLGQIQNTNIAYFCIWKITLIEINNLGSLDLQSTFYHLEDQKKRFLYHFQQTDWFYYFLPIFLQNTLVTL